MIRLIADVHGATAHLRRVAAAGGTLLILGDLINFIDYRTLEGIVADINGREFVAEMIRLRAAGDPAAARALWRSAIAGREHEVGVRFDTAIRDEYRAVGEALTGAVGYATHGNVDRPELLESCLPEGMRYVDGEAVVIGGRRFGFAGGGMPTALGLPGEVDDATMRAKLDQIGPVDVLCSHLPPAVPALSQDVIGGRVKGSEAILDYLLSHQPPYHYFGDIHQPQASRWRIGATRSVNVGYFRATGRGVVHD